MRYLLYHDLAKWWPLLSSPDDCAEVAALCAHLIAQVTGGPPASVLELGSGGGALASHFPPAVALTLTDLSPEMLAICRQRNPAAVHVLADMRTMRLGRTVDAVLIHDAIMYMTCSADLAAALRTAAAHCRPGGALLIFPDVVAETFTEGTLTGGFADDEGSAAQLLEWHHSPTESTYQVDFAFLLREQGAVRCVHEQHTMGLFDRQTWWRLITEAGFVPVAADLPLDVACGEVFLARRVEG